MGRKEETTSIKGQEDQATLSLTAFDKEKLVAMQQQVLEGMTQHGSSPQCLPQGQTNIPKGPMKRQVAEAWKKMKSNEGASSNTLEVSINVIVVNIMVFLVFETSQLRRKSR